MPVALLDPAFELIAAAIDHVEIIVGQLSPLLLDLAFDLLPVPFDSVPVHLGSPWCLCGRESRNAPTRRRAAARLCAVRSGQGDPWRWPQTLAAAVRFTKKAEAGLRRSVGGACLISPDP